MSMWRAVIVVVLASALVGCAACEAYCNHDAAPPAGEVGATDEGVVVRDGGPDASVSDVGSPVDTGTDASMPTSCNVGAGHTCSRWVTTQPHGDRACLGYDGLGTICASTPTTSCNVGSGHSCSRWVQTQPNGEWACLGYDGFGVVCASPPTTSCDVGSGHTCSRWVQTQPSGEWACLGYDGFGTACM